MNILKSIQLRPTNSILICENCIHFQSDASAIETIYPGMKIMSSGFASVRDKDGICSFLNLYLSARDSCPHFKMRETEMLENDLGKT
jgi:hypothetical protein